MILCPRCGLELTSEMLNRRGGKKAFGTMPGEAETLAWMREMRAVRGVTFDSIAKALNAFHHPTRTGKPWRISTVAGILSRVTAPGDDSHRHAADGSHTVKE
jgi:hypothetical protein